MKFLPVVPKCVHEPVQQDVSQHFKDSHDFSVPPSEVYASRHAASQQDYSEFSRQWDYASQPTFDATGTQVVQDDNTQVVQDDITQVVQDDITQVVQDDITQVVQDDITQVVRDDITQVVQDYITQVVQDDFTQVVQDAIASPVVCSASPMVVTDGEFSQGHSQARLSVGVDSIVADSNLQGHEFSSVCSSDSNSQPDLRLHGVDRSTDGPGSRDKFIGQSHFSRILDTDIYSGWESWNRGYS